MRIVNGSNHTSGRLEVNYNHMGWGTVCDDYWSIEDADVACKMLGQKSAISAPPFAYFGEGNGTIWFDDFLCLGNESTLLQCSHSGLGIHNCQHSEDASVVCSGKVLLLKFIVYMSTRVYLQWCHDVWCSNFVVFRVNYSHRSCTVSIFLTTTWSLHNKSPTVWPFY